MNELQKTFGNLVVLADGEPRASTDVISAGMKQRHASVIKLVRKHLASLEGMGRVRFEIQTFATRGGLQSREVASLNEHQAALLVSLMRNNQEVIAFKVALVNEFFRIRDSMQQRDKGLWQQMQALIAREVESKVRASFGSHLMLVRKREAPCLRSEHERLELAIQPRLPLMH